MRIVVAGPIAFDTVETPHGKREDLVGGAATYFALAARFFAPVAIVSAVGRDFPKRELDYLASVGLDLEGVQVRRGKTFRWSGLYRDDMNHRDTLELKVNVFSSFQATVPQSYRESEACFLANMDPVLQLRVLDQLRGPRLVAMDTMDHWIQSRPTELQRLLGRVSLLIINEQEAALLSGKATLARAAREIFLMGPQHLVIKRGAYGAIYFTKESAFTVPAYPVARALDPTGAGDSFAGGSIGHLAACGSLSPQDIRRAMGYGSVLASFTVEEFGLERLRSLGADDVERRLKEFEAMTPS